MAVLGRGLGCRSGSRAHSLGRGLGAGFPPPCADGGRQRMLLLHDGGLLGSGGGLRGVQASACFGARDRQRLALRVAAIGGRLQAMAVSVSERCDGCLRAKVTAVAQVCNVAVISRDSV